MKKVISLLIACSLLISMISVQAVSFNVSDESLESTPTPEPTPMTTTEVQGTENGVQTYSSIIADGYCGGEGDGTNLTWTLYDDGLLEISGTGRMEDYL